MRVSLGLAWKWGCTRTYPSLYITTEEGGTGKNAAWGQLGACAGMPVVGDRPGGHLRLLRITNESGECARELLETALVMCRVCHSPT